MENIVEYNDSKAEKRVYFILNQTERDRNSDLKLKLNKEATTRK